MSLHSDIDEVVVTWEAFQYCVSIHAAQNPHYCGWQLFSLEQYHRGCTIEGILSLHILIVRSIIRRSSKYSRTYLVSTWITTNEMIAPSRPACLCDAPRFLHP